MTSRLEKRVAHATVQLGNIMRQAADEAAAAALRYEALQAQHAALEADYMALDAVSFGLCSVLFCFCFVPPRCHIISLTRIPIHDLLA